jgi:hypothetical protein
MYVDAQPGSSGSASVYVQYVMYRGYVLRGTCVGRVKAYFQMDQGVFYEEDSVWCYSV